MNTTVEKVEFPEFMKDKLESFIKRKNLGITYENGSIVRFHNTNIDVLEPHKIILETENNQVVLLYFGNYLENKNKFYLYNLANPISFTTLQELVKNLV